MILIGWKLLNNLWPSQLPGWGWNILTSWPGPFPLQGRSGKGDLYFRLLSFITLKKVPKHLNRKGSISSSYCRMTTTKSILESFWPMTGEKQRISALEHAYFVTIYEDDMSSFLLRSSISFDYIWTSAGQKLTSSSTWMWWPRPWRLQRRDAQYRSRPLLGGPLGKYCNKFLTTFY